MPPKHDRKMRELAVELFDEGYGRDIVAARLCMSASIVEKWLLTYRSVGSEVLLCMGSRKTRYAWETKAAAARAVVDEGMGKPEAMAAFRSDQYLWWQVAELSFDVFQVRTRAR